MLRRLAVAASICLAFSPIGAAWNEDKAASSYAPEEIDPLAEVLPEDKNELFDIMWEDLLPPGEDEIYAAQYASLFSMGIEEGSPGDIATQIGTFNTVGILDGHKIRIPGFTVPFEFGRDAKVNEFLLVPYYGACLHQPPPPPNQTVLVKTDKPIKLRDLAQAVWIEGYIATESSFTDLANSAYTITMTDLEVYEY